MSKLRLGAERLPRRFAHCHAWFGLGSFAKRRLRGKPDRSVALSASDLIARHRPHVSGARTKHMMPVSFVQQTIARPTGLSARCSTFSGGTFCQRLSTNTS